MRRSAAVSTNRDPVRVLILESSKMSGQLLADALMQRDDCYQVCCTDSSSEFFAQAQSYKPHVVIISANLEESSTKGLSVAQQMRSENPDVRIVLLCDSSKRDLVVIAFRTGVSGVFSRTEPLSALAKCIQSVHLGQIWANSRELRFVMEALAETGAPILVDSRGQALLSKRESEAVRLAVSGMTNAEVAKKMKLSEHTIKNYLRKIFDKLGVCNRVELVLYACAQGGVAPWTAPIASTAGASHEEDRAAFNWYLEAAGRGCGVAQFAVAQMYRDGRGIEQDSLSAYAWLLIAENNPDESSRVTQQTRNRIASHLNAEQITEARQRADRLLRKASMFRAVHTTGGVEVPTLFLEDRKGVA